MLTPIQRYPLTEAFNFFKAGRLEEAAELCRTALSHVPDQLEANHLLGVIYFRLGKLTEARDFLERTAKSERATAEMHNNYGAVLNALGESGQAMEAFRRALSLDPGYPWALNNLGCIYRDRKLIHDAIEAFRRAIDVKPDFAEAKDNLRSSYRDMVPASHFTMIHDRQRNDAYEAAIGRACAGKRVLEIGSGAGLLSMMAARAGAKHVTSCEAVSEVAENARLMIAENGYADSISVVEKQATDLALGRDLAQPAEVLITETFSSDLLNEGILPAVEHAHRHLLRPDATFIPLSISAMGFLVGGEALRETLFVGQVKGFDLSHFSDFAPPSIAVELDGRPHDVLSADVELFRFDLRQAQFPMMQRPLTLLAIRAGICLGVAQWVRIELDLETQYGNRPSPDGVHSHWSHLVHRFPKPVAVEAGQAVQIVARHDRTQINVSLA